MTQIALHEGDNRESLRRLIDAGVRVHSVVTDPPYGLTSITKRFGKDGSAPAKSQGATGVFGRSSAGFMGQKWDGSGIERDPEFWSLIWEILLPGGYVVAFSGSRTGHWQACAMEQAGFIMHPMIGWVTGQGFPKAHNASKAIDRELGADRPVVGKNKGRTGGSAQPNGGSVFSDDNYQWPGEFDVTASGSPEAAQWEGWAYGGQAMKPALEPIYVGQKPFSEKNGALNLLKHGVGALNIDGCRVGDEALEYRTTSYREASSGEFSNQGQTNHTTGSKAVVGRHPANLIHDGSDAVVALFPNSKGAQGDVRGTEPSRTGDDNTHCYGEFGRVPSTKRNDGDGSAARFFNSFPVEPDAIYYHPKATKADRNGSKHPTVKPVPLMQWLVRLVTPPGGTILDPFAGSGTTGQAAINEGFNAILMEAEPAYIADIKRRFNLPTATDDFDDLIEDDFDSFLGAA